MTQQEAVQLVERAVDQGNYHLSTTSINHVATQLRTRSNSPEEHARQIITEMYYSYKPKEKGLDFTDWVVGLFGLQIILIGLSLIPMLGTDLLIFSPLALLLIVWGIHLCLLVWTKIRVKIS